MKKVIENITGVEGKEHLSTHTPYKSDVIPNKFYKDPKGHDKTQIYETIQRVNSELEEDNCYILIENKIVYVVWCENEEVWYYQEEAVLTIDDGWYNENEVTYIECSGEYIPEDKHGDYDVDWDNNDECHRFTDNMRWGWISSREEGYFSDQCEFIYSEHGDCYFMNDQVAYDLDYDYCDRNEDWRHSDYLENDEDEDSDFDNMHNIIDTKTSLTHGMNYTFGVEIETCGENKITWSDYSVASVYDGSITGKEYKTGVLQGDKGIKEVEKICKQLKDADCRVDKSCGIHVHIGGANFNRRFSLLTIMLGQLLQEELFNSMPKSRRSNTYCLKIPTDYLNSRNSLKVKYQTQATKQGKKTIKQF